MKPNQVQHRHIVYAIQEQLKKAGKMSRAPNIGTSGHGQNSRVVEQFFIAPKPNNTVCLCLDPVLCNQAFTIPVHGEPIINDILPKLTNVCYMTLIGTNTDQP